MMQTKRYNRHNTNNSINDGLQLLCIAIIGSILALYLNIPRLTHGFAFMSRILIIKILINGIYTIFNR